MSAPFPSADMIETPPVLNFEEIDYKEIEVEEVSALPLEGGAAASGLSVVSGAATSPEPPAPISDPQKGAVHNPRGAGGTDYRL